MSAPTSGCDLLRSRGIDAVCCPRCHETRRFFRISLRNGTRLETCCVGFDAFMALCGATDEIAAMVDPFGERLELAATSSTPGG